jgi:hypothetical protein
VTAKWKSTRNAVTLVVMLLALWQLLYWFAGEIAMLVFAASFGAILLRIDRRLHHRG